MNQSNSPAKRIPLQLDIFFKKNYARQDSSGTLSNISITGAFLKTDASRLKENEKIMVYFEVSGRKRKIVANVIWKNSLGAGINFSPTSNRDVQIIDDLMYFVESSREGRRALLDSIFKKAS